VLKFSRLKAALILGVCLIGMLLSIPSFLKPGTLPAWVPQPRINLGLDLQGGSYLLLDVDMNAVIKERLANLRSEVLRSLRGAGVRPTEVAVRDQGVVVEFASASEAASGREALKDIVGALIEGRLAGRVYNETLEGTRLTITFTPQALADLATKTAEQSISIVRRRIDETGVNEPVVARQGQGRILVELPGVSDPDRIKRLLGSTAKMTFRLVAPPGTPADAETELLPLADKERGAVTARIPVRRHIEVDGANLTQANAVHDPRGGGWVVEFALDSIGTKRFADVSTKHVGEPFAIVLDGKVISAPVIREPILGGRGQISGNFTVQEAHDLAVLLRAGALPAPLHVAEERTVGPSLGADAIRAGVYSIAAGFCLVVTYILLFYGRFGLYACIALVANLALTLSGLALMSATLTLTGIAGLLLALGMAVDANILVNERIREEVKRGKGVITPIETGFRRAYATILDANVTTLIKMLILFGIGVGAIRGFAITISLGILISMFTSLVLVRLLISLWIERSRPKTLSVGTRFRLLPEGTGFHFMRARYSGLALSALISAASLALAYSPGLKMGVDFAGGIVIEARTQGLADHAALRTALGSMGLGPVQVQQFGGPSDVLLRFEQPSSGERGQQDAVNKVRVEVEKVAPGTEIRRVEVVGPALGSELLQDGLLALAVASFAMLGYIAWRFEWPFAVGAVVTMLLDLTKTVGFLALTGFEFNLAAIAAILTIMGFSINDKVVVYDRVRENLSKFRRMPLSELIDRSINETLSRTVGTSLALLLAIAPLALFGGPALREFALTLLFGLLLATSSSIFIAAPILLNLGERRLRIGASPAAGTPIASTRQG
jgi:SecD/SecF fusion protein